MHWSTPYAKAIHKGLTQCTGAKAWRKAFGSIPRAQNLHFLRKGTSTAHLQKTLGIIHCRTALNVSSFMQKGWRIAISVL